MDSNDLEILPVKALTYIEHGKFALIDKPKPVILDFRNAVVRVTLGSICTSDPHIKHGFFSVLSDKQIQENVRRVKEQIAHAPGNSDAVKIIEEYTLRKES